VGEGERPMPRSEYRRRAREIHFEIELLLHRWGVSDFIYDEEGQVFRDREGRTVLTRHYAERDRTVGGEH
jgi:hypothetical protein